MDRPLLVGQVNSILSKGPIDCRVQFVPHDDVVIDVRHEHAHHLVVGAEGADRQQAYEDIFTYQNENVVQFATIAHQTGILGKSAAINYTPNSSSGDELRLTEMTPAS